MVDLVNWDSMKMGKLFSAYHIGYCICFPIFHNLADRLGPTWVVGIAGMLSGVMSCLTPAAAYSTFWMVFMVRTIEGFCAGAMQPSMVQVLRYWVPPTERNHLIWAYSGVTMGTFATYIMCSAVHYYSRWSVGFYLAGSLQILWAITWVFVVTDVPRKHPCISERELTYLINTIGTIFTIKLTNSRTPWKLILKSIPFWMVCILNFGYSWMIISLCIHGPLYYSKVARYNIYSASAITAVPFFFRLVLGTILIYTFHYYKHKPQIRRITHIRKYFILVSHVIPGVMVTSTWMLHVIPGPVLLSTAVALTAAGMDLTMDLCHELTPMFMNSINTVIKIIGNTSGVVISLCVGSVTQKYKHLPHVWKHIWCFHATVLLISGCMFLIWGETEVQHWNFTRSVRAHPKYLAKPSTTMSDIIEVDEDKSSQTNMTPESNL
ncbi:sialin-like isoform X2 [Anticarsia gemmatalis]